MSMSQLPSPDEEYEAMWAKVRWWQLLALALGVFVIIPILEVTCWLSGLRQNKGKESIDK